MRALNDDTMIGLLTAIVAIGRACYGWDVERDYDRTFWIGEYTRDILGDRPDAEDRILAILAAWNVRIV